MDRNSQIGKGDKELFERIESFVDREKQDSLNREQAEAIRKALQENREASLKLQKEMDRIILKIEAGEPLTGRCDICPRVLFRKTQKS